MNNSTYVQPLDETQLKLAATGYLPDGSMTKGKRHTYPEMAAAGLWTTSEDLAKFVIDVQNTLKGQSATVLSQEMVEKMLTPFVTDFIGMGIFLPKVKEDRYFMHGGWDEGFSSKMIAHKDNGYGVVVLTNSNHPDFIDELIRSVALTYSWSNFVPVYKKLPMDTTHFNEILGRYRNGNDGLIHIFSQDDRLFVKYLREDKPTELFKISDTEYISRTNTRPFEFTTDIGGQTVLTFENENGSNNEIHVRMKEDEVVPYEHLLAGEFEKALAGYQDLMKANPRDVAIAENNLNTQGYRFLSSGKMNTAKDIFKVNMILYPNSFNVYDSYAEACMKNGEKELAIANYEKSLMLNPRNTNAVKMLEELRK
jgi:hypothetical protein